MQEHEVIVVGGSYAGMAAALQLLRARRSVRVIDAGEPRNRFARHSHGFLGQDGADPRRILADARRQLERYPGLSWSDARAVGIAGGPDGFAVATSEGRSHRGRRVLLALGVTDTLPDIDGLSERWGTSVFHCPYCHGYELDRGRIGVVATGPASLHQAQFLPEWGRVTLLTNQTLALDAEARSDLAARGVAIEAAPIERVEGVADVRLADGRRLSFDGLFVAPLCAPSGGLAEAAGCAMEATPMGLQVRIDAEHLTSVPGIFACGDAAQAPHSVSLAVGHGAMAGIQVHRSLWAAPAPGAGDRLPPR